MKTDIQLLSRKFARTGARVKFTPARSDARRRSREGNGEAPIGVDVVRDRHGEVFEIALGQNTEVNAVDVRPDLRHLLLFARLPNGEKRTFLCGHDERHWFAAAVPRNCPTVAQAMEALKPEEVRLKQALGSDLHKNLLRRRNKAFIRQGEWFFLPEKIDFPKDCILRNEPIRRNPRAKPHLCEELVRDGGQSVAVRHGRVIPLKRFLSLPSSAREGSWRVMRQDAAVFVRGRITHPDHATLVLKGWHRVVPNTENEAPGRENLRFLD